MAGLQQRKLEFCELLPGEDAGAAASGQRAKQRRPLRIVELQFAGNESRQAGPGQRRHAKPALQWWLGRRWWRSLERRRRSLGWWRRWRWRSWRFWRRWKALVAVRSRRVSPAVGMEGTTRRAPTTLASA